MPVMFEVWCGSLKKTQVSKFACTTMYKSLLGEGLVLGITGVVWTYQTVYSAHLQENAGLMMKLRSQLSCNGFASSLQQF